MPDRSCPERTDTTWMEGPLGTQKRQAYRRALLVFGVRDVGCSALSGKVACERSVCAQIAAFQDVLSQGSDQEVNLELLHVPTQAHAQGYVVDTGHASIILSSAEADFFLALVLMLDSRAVFTDSSAAQSFARGEESEGSDTYTPFLWLQTKVRQGESTVSKVSENPADLAMKAVHGALLEKHLACVLRAGVNPRQYNRENRVCVCVCVCVCVRVHSTMAESPVGERCRP
eukprot:6455307-Amphidinium_carterae.4